MATILPVGILFSILFMISPASSLDCSTQKFTGNRSFSNCSDLPTLSSILHWTYNSSRSTLSVAFTAKPAASDGWVAWAINPTGAFMAGAQSLVAFKQGGAIIVKPFVLNNYSSIVPTNLSYPVSETSGEEVDGTISLFATFQLPEKKTKFYHIWQVGAAVESGFPTRHEFKKENLDSKGTFDLIAGEGVPGGAPVSPPSESPSESLGGSPTVAPSPHKAGESGIRKNNIGYYLLLSLASLLIFYF